MSQEKGPQPAKEESMILGAKEKNPTFHNLRNWMSHFFDWYQLIPGKHQINQQGVRTKPSGWSQRITRWRERKYPSVDVIAKMLIEQGFELRLEIKPPEGMVFGRIRQAAHEDREGVHARLDPRLAFLDAWEDQYVKIEGVVEQDGQYFYRVLKKDNLHLHPFTKSEVLLPALEVIALNQETYDYLKEQEASEKEKVA